jgi:hypothetical protein
VRYVVKGEPRAIAICHCTHCQRQSGSLFSFNLVVREADYEQSGETMVYVDKGDSGQPVYRHFCGRCGSPILATIAAAPGKVVAKAGTLDNMEGLEPRTEIYTRSCGEMARPGGRRRAFWAESMTVGIGSGLRGGHYGRSSCSRLRTRQRCQIC